MNPPVSVYLVDDHAIMREGLRAMLEAEGWRVAGETGDPATALSELPGLQPDLVLLDLSLGARSGLELLAALKQRELPLRCLVLTMSAQPRHVAEAFRLGAAGCVLKGASRGELLQAMQAVAAGRRYIGPQVAELAAQALAADTAPDPLAELSPRERQIVTRVVKGESSAAIGARLHLSPKTVDTYRSRLMSKLGVSDITGLVRFAIRVGLIDAGDS